MRDERGFALIAALWFLVALSTVGLELGLSMRGWRLANANAVEAVRTHAAAEAGVEHARARLDRLLSEGATPFDDRAWTADVWHRPERLFPDSLRLGDVRYRVVLRDAASALNANYATEVEIRRFLVALRLDAARADRLAQAIVDWRDADHDRRARGAESDEYLQAGSPVLPRDGLFQSVEELRFVRGMDEDVFRRVEPHVTLLGSGYVNLNSAGREVMLALEGMSEEAVSVVLRLRRSGPIGSLDELSLELRGPALRALQANMAGLRRVVSFQTHEVEFLSEAWMAGGRSPTRVHGLFVRAANVVFLPWRRTL